MHTWKKASDGPGRKNVRRFAIAGVLVCLTLVACDSSKTGRSTSNGGPTAPDGVDGCSNISSLGAARGTITAVIDGEIFNGGVPEGQAAYVPIAAQPALGLPAQDLITLVGTCGDGSSLTITARAILGTTMFGAGVVDPRTGLPWPHQAVLQRRSDGGAAGTWSTNSLDGSGSITLTTVSPSGAAGSFAFTMIPQAGTVAEGTKQAVGEFGVTFR